jgi:hypothetical protein
MAHRVVHVHDQFLLAIFPLGTHIFLKELRCNNCQKMVLIEFLFAGKGIEARSFVLMKNAATIALCIEIDVLVLGGTSTPDFV